VSCIPRYLKDKLADALKSGELKLEKLAYNEKGLMRSSEERRAMLAKYVGEEPAKTVNAEFESKLLLKDQQRGIISWAEKTIQDPKAKKDIIDMANKMTDVLNDKNKVVILGDFVARKFGFGMTDEQAANISTLAKLAGSARIAMEGKRGEIGSSVRTPEEKAYGDAAIAFSNYISDLKAKSANKSIYEYMKLKNWGTAVSETAGVAKAMKAALDLSGTLRQGIKMLFTHPTIWWESTAKEFKAAWDSLGGKNVMDSLHSWVVSDPEYNNMVRDKLDVNVMEEARPSHWPARIPVLGRLFKASDDAYTTFMLTNRVLAYKHYTAIARASGFTETTGMGIGELANSLTSRGNLGRLEPIAGTINNVMFAPKNLKANWDVLTAHAFSKDMSSFARKEAAVNLVKIISGTAATLALAEIFWPDSVDKDPRSTDFGKIKIGDTRFDVSGGMAGIATLAMRILPTENDGKWSEWSKSSTTGKMTDLRAAKWGQGTGKDVIFNFFENKASPAVSVVKEILEGKDFQGKPITATGELSNLLMPLPVSTYQELANNPNSANIVISMIAETLGVSTNTYSQYSKFTDAELKDKLSKSIKKDGMPHKGSEDNVKALKKEINDRKSKGITR
jgi:hypothetical protein